MSLLMIEIDKDLAVAPYHVASLEVAKRRDPRLSEQVDTKSVWGVLVVMAGGNVYFRPTQRNEIEQARELMARWRRLINGKD